MVTLLEMPRGGEWLVLLAVVVLLFGPTKLPGLVRQLGRAKKIWDNEISNKQEPKATIEPPTPTDPQT
jgi:sec-independent protein translocase protein TatA